MTFSGNGKAIDLVRIILLLVIFSSNKGLKAQYFESSLTLDVDEIVQELMIFDFNQDGLRDIGYSHDWSHWNFSNNLGSTEFAPFSTVFQSIGNEQLIVGDYNGDGSLDLSWSGYFELGWYENMGSGNFQSVDTIEIQLLRSIYTADVNTDGFDDIVAVTHTAAIYWLEGGIAGLMDPVMLIEGIVEVPIIDEDLSFEDFDGDGDIDILQLVDQSFYGPYIRYFQNESMSFESSSYVHSTGNSFNTLGIIESIDLDQDGDLDVVTNFEDQLIGFEKLSPLLFSGPQILMSNVLFAESSFSADINSDGLTDLVLGHVNNDLSWYENEGNGIFSLGQLISDAGVDISLLSSGDLDLDGDIDIVVPSISGYEVKIFWNSQSPNGIQEFKAEGFSVYPSPALREVAIEFEGLPLNSRIVIYDMLGIELISTEVKGSSSNLTINVKDWSPGMYFIRLIADGLLLGEEKLVVQ